MSMSALRASFVYLGTVPPDLTVGATTSRRFAPGEHAKRRGVRCRALILRPWINRT